MPERRRAETVPSLTARQPRAIHSALTVLEAVAALGAGVTAREISDALGLPRATTYRLVNLLVEDEYLVRTRDLSGFALGAKVAQLAAVAVPVRLPTAARAVLAETRSALRGGVHVVLFGEGRLTIADADPDFPLSDELRLAREPARYALGRIAHVESGAHDEVARAAAVDLARFGATRQLGETTPGVACIAVPIRDDGGRLAAAIGFSGAVHRVGEPAALLHVLRPAAERLAPLIT
ncbi:helix-turn-helix domain-containing protein [Microbacterium sp. 18062]|uniref:helix-turn-helix domain-containing protein n=1 Tax=Microbacterium sp. 18062 TaxID=2681410 RepID=UPI00135A2003|nr:helix-turn-helix domain-containing protein [Microbacterium sp. 18062]